MSLNWDLRKVENQEEMCWQASTHETGKYELQPVTNALVWSTMLVGIGSITKNNYKEFHQRLLEFEVIQGEGLLHSRIDGESYYRMPYIEEVEAHIGLSTNASLMDRRKWGSRIKRMVEEKARTLKRSQEQEYVNNNFHHDETPSERAMKEKVSA